MSTVSLRLFFDESGKRRDKPNLMGGLSIPESLYTSDKFNVWNQKLRDQEIRLHWVGYTGDEKVKNSIIQLMEVVSKHHRLLKFNIISYDYNMLTGSGRPESVISQIVYSKFPERLIYGLLRGYGRDIHIDAHIFIEHSTEYKDIRLNETIKEQLNVQSIYRGEQFHVCSSRLVPKGEEIGIELTDLLLGIVRTIIRNESDSNSKSIAAKNLLIVELLKNQDFYSFLTSFRLFEWSRTRELQEASFGDYIQVFLSNHHDKFES